MTFLFLKCSIRSKTELNCIYFKVRKIYMDSVAKSSGA